MNLSTMRYKGFTWPHNPRVYSISFERKAALRKIPFGNYHIQDLGLTRRVMRGEGEFVGEDAYQQFKKLATVFYDNGPGTLIHPLWDTSSAWFMELSLEQEPRPDYVKYRFAFWEDYPHYQTGLERMGSVSTAGILPGSGSGNPSGGTGSSGSGSGNPSGGTGSSGSGTGSSSGGAGSSSGGSGSSSGGTGSSGSGAGSSGGGTGSSGGYSTGAVPSYHIVVKGETMWGIARRYGVNLNTLIALNPQIRNPNLIYIGQKVRVA